MEKERSKRGRGRDEVRERTCLTLAEEERGGNNFCWEKMDGKDGRRGRRRRRRRKRRKVARSRVFKGGAKRSW